MPNSLSALPKQPAETVVSPEPEIKPIHQYAYKRLGFNSSLSKQAEPMAQVAGKSRLPIHTVVNVPHQAVNIKSEVHLNGDFAQPRIRTQINVHDKREANVRDLIKPVASQLPAVLQKQAEPSINNAISSPKPSDKQIAIEARIAQHVAWYNERTGFLRQVAERANPYLFHVVDTLVKNHLPAELALLPIVESAYQSNAQSPKSAAGLWQFIPDTGLEYDLQQNEAYDERYDVISSTHAAARYLHFLHQRYKGDWLLALAAYNCGPGTVDNALSANESKGLATDFWSLSLPEESLQYVPRFLALVKIFANPNAYGLKPNPVTDEPYLVKTAIDEQVDIRYLANKNLQHVAELAGLDPKRFELFNPAYLQAQLPETGPYEFVMPIANANQLHRHLAHIAYTLTLPKNKNMTVVDKSAAPRPWYLQNIPLPSAPFLSLAQTDGKASAQSLQANKRVPQANTISHKDGYIAVHYVDKGETLKSIAKYYGVKLEALCATNRFKAKQSLAWGQRLLIPNGGFING
ncbi:hypothetical protein JCM14076_29420 [Methylosoma difficile]